MSYWGEDWKDDIYLVILDKTGREETDVKGTVDVIRFLGELVEHLAELLWTEV